MNADTIATLDADDLDTLARDAAAFGDEGLLVLANYEANRRAFPDLFGPLG